MRHRIVDDGQVLTHEVRRVHAQGIGQEGADRAADPIGHVGMVVPKDDGGVPVLAAQRDLGFVAMDQDLLFIDALLDIDAGATLGLEGAQGIDGGLDGREIAAPVLGDDGGHDGRGGIGSGSPQQGAQAAKESVLHEADII